MAKVKKLNDPIGWLIDPHNKWAIHFDHKRVSNDDFGTDCTIDMWGILPNGKPMQFKSRRKATKEDSIKTWNQLIESNWIKSDFDKRLIA
tara:strand:- start:82 stop:351 length:270 start_codon:yes stop_codon:yes gene_type:complete